MFAAARGWHLRDLRANDPRPKPGAFKAYEPGYLHVDVKYLPQMADESSRRYLFVAIDRGDPLGVHPGLQIQDRRQCATLLRDLERACPLRIRTILTDNGKEFTDRLFGLRKREATGRHEFDLLCTDLGIEHRLAPPQHPQTNGMVERFNGGLKTCCKATTSVPARSWKRRWTDTCCSTISSFLNQLWTARPPCRR